MDYKETIAYIHAMPKFSRKLGNTMLRRLLECLGNPQDELRFIHIAGTNGKGSVAAMLAKILSCAGFKTGLFTSPYIERFNERIRIGDQQISDTELSEIVTGIRNVIEKEKTEISEFALDTAVAFCYFAKEKCDLVVLETGLGGRLDATNVISKNLVTVLTAIGLDHTQYLGDTIEKITAEKCGIFKPGCPVVSSPGQEVEVCRVIRQYADEKNVPLFFAAMPEWEDQKVLYGGHIYQLGLEGTFQAENAAVVIEAVQQLRKQGFIISEEALRRGLAETKHVARFERFGGNIILDGGHNPQAAEKLCESLRQLKKPVYFCTAMMEDKDYIHCAEIFAEIAAGAITTQIDMPRCCHAQNLAFAFEKYGVRAIPVTDPEKAVLKALKMAEKNGIVCICGSLYLAGNLRPFLKKMFT